MLIAVPLTDESFEENVKEIKKRGADIVELRVDQFSRTEAKYVLGLVEVARGVGLKTILTVRSEKEGGKEVPSRVEVFKKVAPLCDFADIELSSRELIPLVRDAVEQGGGRLIVSFHDFERTPPNWVLKEVLREGHRYGGIPKVSVMANSYEDVARLVCVAGQESYEKIVIAMGEIGKVSRLLSPVVGSVISYASFGKSLAPGQLPLEKLVELRKLLYEGKVE